MNIELPIYLQKTIHFIIILISLIVLLNVAKMAGVAIDNNFPNHGRESAEVIATHAISNGESPNSLSTYPKNVNGYILFNHVFSSLFVSVDDGYLNIVNFMRTSFWVTSFLAAILLFAVCRREKVPISLACLVTVIYLIHLTCLRNEMGSKPGGMGNLIFILGMIVPYFFRFSLLSMVTGICFLVLATFTKKLFLVGIPVLVAYYFLFHSRAKGLMLGMFSLLLFFTSLALYELYLPNSMGIFDNSHFTFGGGRWGQVIMEKIQVIYSGFWPLIYLSLLGVFYSFYNVAIRCREQLFNNKKSITLKKNDSVKYSDRFTTKAINFCKTPLQNKMNYSIFSALTIIFLYYGYLVKDTLFGHFYYNQLFLFFGLWASTVVAMYIIKNIEIININSAFIKLWPYLKSILVIALYGAFISTFYFSYTLYESMNSRVRTNHADDWVEIRSVLAPYNKVLGFRSITPILLEQNKEFYDSGHLPYSIDVATPNNRSYLLSRINDYKQSIRNKVRDGYFDALFLNYNGLTYSIDGVSFRKEDLLGYGYQPVYAKQLNSTLGSSNIRGWEKVK